MPDQTSILSDFSNGESSNLQIDTTDMHDCPYCETELTVDCTVDGYMAFCCNEECPVMPLTNDDHDSPEDALLSMATRKGVTATMTGLPVANEDKTDG